MAARDPRDRRHHARDARRLGAGRVLEEVSAALLRRGDCRTARRDVRGRPGLRGAQTRGGHLLHVPAARLRPADPRRGAAEPAGGVRAGSRRSGRRRRRHAPGQLRPRIPALHSEPDGDGAGRRERVPPDAVHRDHARRSLGGALSARPGPGRRAGRGDDRAAGGQGADPPHGIERLADPRVRRAGEIGARSSASGSMRPWSTCAS